MTDLIGDFNPRSPHGERRLFSIVFVGISAFQSTLPARGATAKGTSPSPVRTFQSTLPARGATNAKRHPQEQIDISIHAPRTGSDSLDFDFCRTRTEFQSTLPARGATKERSFPMRMKPISIHAPRTGSDGVFDLLFAHAVFQSTLPARGATRRIMPGGGTNFISIHAPRTGSDARGGNKSVPRRGFQSTLPARGATAGYSAAPSSKRTHFNPRSPHGERPLIFLHLRTVNNYFNPRSPHGERHTAGRNFVARCAFQSTLPARGATEYSGIWQ